MLVLSRRTGEAIVIEINGVIVTLVVNGVCSDRVRLGITAPPEVRVDRQEVVERRRAAEASGPAAAGDGHERESRGRAGRGEGGR